MDANHPYFSWFDMCASDAMLHDTQYVIALLNDVVGHASNIKIQKIKLIFQTSFEHEYLFFAQFKP